MDFSGLGKYSAATASKLLHEICDGICGRQPPRHQDYSSTLDLEQWWELLDSCRTFLGNAIRDNWTKDQLSENLESVDAELKGVVHDVLSVRRAEMRQALVSSTCAISECHLKDFDWKLKLTLSSDKLSSVQEPLAALDLHLQKDKLCETVSLEMNQQELGKLITSLEAANKVVLQMKTKT